MCAYGALTLACAEKSPVIATTTPLSPMLLHEAELALTLLRPARHGSGEIKASPLGRFAWLLERTAARGLVAFPGLAMAASNQILRKLCVTVWLRAAQLGQNHEALGLAELPRMAEASHPARTASEQVAKCSAAQWSWSGALWRAVPPR